MGNLIQAGAVAPDFTTQDFTGKKWALSELRGKPVLLALYKSTCPYCEEELPKLAPIFAQAPDTVIVLGVAVGHDDASMARSFSKMTGLTIPVGLDADRSIRQAYGLRLVPSVVAIDGEGKVQKVFEGSARGLAGAVRETIQALATGGKMPSYNVVGDG